MRMHGRKTMLKRKEGKPRTGIPSVDSHHHLFAGFPSGGEA